MEEVATAIADNGLVILDQFVDAEDQIGLIKAFNDHWNRENFREAGIGSSYLYTRDKSIRSDEIMWLSDQPQKEALAVFSNRVQALMKGLNPLLFLSLRDVEMHLAFYPVGGHYDRHIDQLKNRGHRVLSFACYLNTDWQAGDGGELRIWQGNTFKDIAPLSGRLVLFRSDSVEHEVRPCLKGRRSITGWMLDRPVDYPIQE